MGGLERGRGADQLSGPRRERFLSIYGPLSMLMLFVTWAASLILSFGLLEWSLQSRATGATVSQLTEQFYMSGITFFTLGYGDVVPHTSAGRFVAVIEAGAGIGFIAVVIGYLPVLYQLFARREAHVIQLDARAGSPPTAAGMLRRHAESGRPREPRRPAAGMGGLGVGADGEPPVLSDARLLSLAARQPVLAGGDRRGDGYLRPSSSSAWSTGRRCRRG